MNQVAIQQPKTPMSAVRVSDTGKGSKIAPKDLNEVVKFAEVMARADIALPKHLRNNAGACMAVAMQALEWQLSPFAVASKSYAVNGAIAYEAQLIAAVVNTRSGIKGRLKYKFEGDGGNMTCTVTGTLDGEECVYTSPPIGSIIVKNSPLWKSDPQQQLGYFAARSWARRHCPEVILGVYDRDETEEFRSPDRAKDITDRVIVDPLNDEPLPRQKVDDVEFNQDFDPETGEITPNTNPGDAPSPAPAGDDEDGYATASSQQPSDQTVSPDLGSTAEPADNPDAPPAAAGSAPSLLPAAWRFVGDDLMWLKDFAEKAIRFAADEEQSQAFRQDQFMNMSATYKADMDIRLSDDAQKAIDAMEPAIRGVWKGKEPRLAREYLAREILGCDPRELEGRKNG
jgi:hypothetical protein